MRPRAGKGFTLVEMMVTVAVAVLMVTVALPAWQVFVQNERLNSTRDQLINAMNQARALSISNDDVVTVCPYNASSASSCGASWSAGWAIFELPQGSASSTRVQAQPLTVGSSPTINAATSAGAAIPSISFNPRPPYVAAAQTGDFRLCDSRGVSYALSFNLQTTGYIQQASRAGVTLAGAALTCP
ncbi:GspH/FimT family pseudopilin [Chromobacterium piscinae]|uniref:GspH/FimT family pseudopilin n=1 Tax=Chromobacterium piscinae TaxID=686831 RepID=UPI001E405A3F|nr:GspH/FimT family pseudopilin [Chromobacterium piscinae]MCD4506923.1 GspH/FimT family pseudopilin [Chromobacterium piscinae]